MKRCNLNNMGIRKKIVLMHLLISVSIAIISLFFLQQSTRTTYENIRALSHTSVEQFSANVSDKFNGLYDFSERLLMEGTLRKYVSQEYAQAYDSYYAYITTLKPIMDVLTLFREDMNVEIYTDNPMLLFSSRLNKSLEDMAQKEWYQGSSFSGKAFWITERRVIMGEAEDLVGFYRSMRLPAASVGAPSYTMTVSVTLPVESLYSMISQEDLGERFVLLCEDDGKILIGSNRSNVFQNVTDLGLDLETMQACAAENRQIRWNHEQYMIVNSALRNEAIGIMDWQVFYLIPVSSINSSNLSLLLLDILMCLLCTALTLIVTYRFAKSMIMRIGQLADTVDEVLNHQFALQVSVTGADEIGSLEKSINAMIQRIHTLRDEVFQTNLQYLSAELKRQQVLVEKRDAEIHALCAQIHPHYLFNTLEAMKMNLLTYQNIPEMVEMLNVFAESFRFFVNTSIDIVTVREEFYFLRNYTTIQRYCYGTSVQYSFSVSKDVLDWRLPKLLLQPLVENALYHGVLPKGKGNIAVAIAAEGEYLVITVSDDGVGMTEEQRAALWKKLYEDPEDDGEYRHGVALRNIVRRLNLIYGARHHFEIDSVPGEGTTVRFCLACGVLEEK